MMDAELFGVADRAEAAAFTVDNSSEGWDDRMKLAGLRAVAEAAWDEAVAEMVRRQQHHDHSAVVNPYREGTL